MLKELQIHPLTQNILHADFYVVPEDRKIRVRVPVVTKGKAAGVELGGILQVIRREVEVLCYAKDIPEIIEIDVADLGINEAIHINDISMPGVEFPADVNFTVVTLLGKKGKEEAESDEESEEEAEGGEE